MLHSCISVYVASVYVCICLCLYILHQCMSVFAFISESVSSTFYIQKFNSESVCYISVCLQSCCIKVYGRSHVAVHVCMLHLFHQCMSVYSKLVYACICCITVACETLFQVKHQYHVHYSYVFLGNKLQRRGEESYC